MIPTCHCIVNSQHNKHVLLFMYVFTAIQNHEHIQTTEKKKSNTCIIISFFMLFVLFILASTSYL